MPRTKTKAETISIPVLYLHVPESRMNSVQFQIPYFNTPVRINAAMCGCRSPDLEKIAEDRNPIHSCLAAALLKSFHEKILIFKNTKNKPLEIKHAVLNNKLLISFITPPDTSSIKQIISIIKKVVIPKTVSKAMKMLQTIDKKYYDEKGRSIIQDTLIDLLQENSMVTIHGKRQYGIPDKRHFEKALEKKLTINRMPQSGKEVVLPITAALPEYQTIYVQMIGFTNIHEGIKALLIVALQVMNVDFFVKTKELYVHRAFLTPENYRVIKMFLVSRLRFVTKTIDEDKKLKKLRSLVAFVYLQGSFKDEVTKDILDINKIKAKDIKQQCEIFEDIAKSSIEKNKSLLNKI